MKVKLLLLDPVEIIGKPNFDAIALLSRPMRISLAS